MLTLADPNAPTAARPIEVRFAAAARTWRGVDARAQGPRGRRVLETLDAESGKLAALLEEAANDASTPSGLGTVATALAIHAAARGRFPDAIAVLDRWMDRLPRLPQTDAATLSYLRAWLLISTGPLDEAARAVGIAEGFAVGDAGLLARVAWLRARIAMTERRYDAAEAELRAAIATGVAVGDRAAASAMLEDLVRALAGKARTSEALDVALEHEKQVVRGGSVEASLSAALALLHLDQLDLDLAERRLRRAAALVSEPLPFELAFRLGAARAELALWRREPEAEEEFSSLLERARRAKAPVFEAYMRYDLAIVALDRGNPAAAQEHAAAAGRIAREFDVPPVLTGARLLESSCHALLGRRADALALLRSARSPELDPQSLRFERGLRALAHLALARLPAGSDERRSHIDAARACLGSFVQGGSGADRVTEMTLFLRVLARILEPLAESAGLAELIGAQGRGPGVAEDGSFIETSYGDRVPLCPRPLLRRLLARLVDQRRRARDEPVPVQVLLDAGWPRDLSAATSLRLRLRVALSGLRALGLGAALEHRRGGYALAPSVRLLPLSPGRDTDSTS